MHLLYLDDSGSVANVNEDYVVLGGISVFETTAHHLSSELDKLAISYDAANPANVEFHASEIFARRVAPWNKLSKEEAKGAIKAVLRVLANANDSTRAFACAIHKASYNNAGDAMMLAFEDLSQRFDFYLDKINSEGDKQKGLLILDDSAYETSLQKLANDFKKTGTQWGSIRHLVDTPFFTNSKASRLIQLADCVAYSIFRRYNSGDSAYFDIIASKFYQNMGVMHGLAHKQKKDANCMCPACYSRRLSKETTQTALFMPS